MEVIIYVIIFIMGSFIGSFTSLAVYRIPKKIDITHKHSYCPNCNHKLQLLDLIPIFSYLFLRGKCRYCNEKIRIRYFILEICSGLIFLIFAISLKFDFMYIEAYKIVYFIFGSIYITTLIIIAGIDKEYFSINKSVIVFGIIIVTLYILYLYTLGHNIYRYAIYLVIILLLVIVDIILIKNKKKSNYTVQILILYFYILLFTNTEVVVLTIILTLILIAAKIINTIIEKKEIQKNNNILLKGNIAVPVGFYICITNIFALILQTYLFFITSG